MKIKFSVLSFILFFSVFACTAFAQSGQGIERLSLNGSWEVLFDYSDIGITEKWFLNDNLNDQSSKQFIQVPSALELTN